MTYFVIRQHGAQVQTMAGALWINSKVGTGQPFDQEQAERIAKAENRRARPAASIAPYWLYSAIAAENKNRLHQTTTTNASGEEMPKNCKQFHGLLNCTTKGGAGLC